MTRAPWGKRAVLLVEPGNFGDLEAAEEVEAFPSLPPLKTLAGSCPLSHCLPNTLSGMQTPLRGLPGNGFPMRLRAGHWARPQENSLGGRETACACLRPGQLGRGGPWLSRAHGATAWNPTWATAASLEVPWQWFVLRQTFLLSLLPHPRAISCVLSPGCIQEMLLA